ncbi:FadR/GntR family transcriptional regulator [Aureimonas psammosilenae]|uniref:FadR/GntR family transcriptional regulator n=1 Tax=Aureimonas psammosilenae TaxID=2495496 RepID=UPI002E26ABAD
MSSLVDPLARFVLENAPELREAVVRRNVRDGVADKIALLIAAGILKVGDDLPSERHLATALQVSRESVRAGIAILGAQGLLKVAHGARTRVVSDALPAPFRPLREPRAVDRYSLDDIHAARLLVERPVVGDAAERITTETIAFLREAVRAQRAGIGDPVRFLISDREFHTAIYRACGNPALADFVVDLFGAMVEFRRHAVAEPGAIEASIADHERIVEALGARDREKAAAAMEEHLDRIYRTTQAAIAKAAKPCGAPHE